MTFLPIVERELRVAARRRGTYGMRMKIAGAATLAFASCFVASQIAPLVPFGKTLFTGLSILCMLYCLAAGRMMTADCLSREKREGTLGLLFLTDLKGFDVVMGKLAATSLNGFYGLLAVFPLLAIPLLTGGMTNGELWRMVLVLVNTFLFSLAIGLFVSAICRDEQRAMAGNFGLILLLAAAPPALGHLLTKPWERRPFPMIHEFFYSCPVYSFLQGADAPFGKSPGHFWRSVGLTFNLTVLLVLLACRIAPRAWQDKPMSPRLLKRKSECGRRWWREGRVEKANAFRRRLLAVNAYFWLAARPYLKCSYVWTCMISFGLWWVFITLMIGYIEEAANFGIAFLLNGMLKLWITTEAGHQLAADKKSGAFELLLSSPLTVADIVRGQWLALRRQFLKPVAVAVILESILMFSIRHIHTQDRTQSWSVWLAGILMLMADVITLGWFAMSAALTEKSHDRATIKTAACVLALPWLLFGGVMLATQLWIILISRQPWEPSFSYGLGWWFGLGILLDVLFLLSARQRVRTSFRQLTLEPSAPKTHVAWLRGWRTGDPDHKTPLRVQHRRLAMAGAVLLAVGAGVAWNAFRALQFKLPAPVIVSITQSNQPVRVFGGHGGFLFILPDGTLWRWAQPLGQETRMVQPQQVGTNRDWAQASVSSPNAVGVRSDGTLWAWSIQGEEPKQIGSNHDWVEARRGWDFLIARKRDGSLWARGNEEKLGNGPVPTARTTGDKTSQSLVQVGTNSDWKAISTSAASATVLALRADGTLWTWGDFNFTTSGVWSHTNNPFPVQVCRESNWVGLGEGPWGGARNQTGEWWQLYPLTGLAGADVPVATIGQLAYSNYATVAFGPFFGADWSWAMYEIQPDHTLWLTTFSWPAIPHLAPTRRFDQRSDWMAVWGDFGTLLGLTSDGTIWTWGTDFGQERHHDFGERLGMVRAAVSNTFEASSRPGMYDDWGGYQPQKEPRPLLRLALTNSVGGQLSPSNSDLHHGT